MKKTILTLAFAVMATVVFAQQPIKQDSTKRDTLVQLTMKINDFRSLMYTIDSNIDSKNVSKSIREFIEKHVQLLADRPKEQKIKKP